MAIFWKNIYVKILNCRLFRKKGQQSVALENLRSKKPPLLKLRVLKLPFLFHLFCISHVNKVQTKIAVMLRIQFLERYYKT